MKIEKGRRVTVKVDLSVVGGDSLEKRTVEYVQGGGTMLPALERLLEGLEKGAKKEGVLEAKDAFGNPASQPLKKMKRTEFPKDVTLKEGEQFTAKGAGGGGMDVVLKLEKITGDDIDVRLVHPLHDKSLKYSLEVVQVSDPRPPPPPAEALKMPELETLEPEQE